MTIQRQYVLPNCSLILEGLSNNDTSDVLSLLASAECKFVGIEQPISGGLAFFQSLVETISQYTQALLSGLPHPPAKTETSMVQLKPGDGPYHHLIVQPESLPNAEPQPGAETAADNIKLSTVQLFDLAEAIDQFFADTQTLPDLKLQLVPLSRRYVRPSEPLAQRATPPLLGLGAFAIAAAGLFWLPIPEIPEPRPENTPAETTSEDPTRPNPSLSNGDPADSTQSDSTQPDSTQPTTTNPEQTAQLQAQLQADLERALLIEPPTLEAALSYQVSVAENGDLIGYRAENELSLASIDQTPLPGLTYLPLEPETEQNNEPVTQFRVVFSPDGNVSVLKLANQPPASSSRAPSGESAPDEASTAALDETETAAATETATETETAGADRGASPEPDSNPRQPQTSQISGQLSQPIQTKIESANQIATLNTQLRRDIIENRDRREFGETLEYRVRLAEDGTLVGYEAHNDAAETYLDETPLPELAQSADPALPQTDFLVVITEGGIVQVSPWSGWN